MGAALAVPAVSAAAVPDDEQQTEAWINGPVGSTIRRLLMTLLGLGSLLLHKKLGQNLDPGTQALLSGIVVAYVGQSAYRSHSKTAAAVKSVGFASIMSTLSGLLDVASTNAPLFTNPALRDVLKAIIPPPPPIDPGKVQ